MADFRKAADARAMQTETHRLRLKHSAAFTCAGCELTWKPEDADDVVVFKSRRKNVVRALPPGKVVTMVVCRHCNRKLTEREIYARMERMAVKHGFYRVIGVTPDMVGDTPEVIERLRGS